MNFLVSKDMALIAQYWTALQENGESQLLSNFSDLLWKARNAKSGLVLLDNTVYGYTGTSCITKLKRINPNFHILLMAKDLTTEDELSALAAGASGSCKLNLPPEKIRRIFSTVENGGVWISSKALPDLLQFLKRLEKRTEKNKPQQIVNVPNHDQTASLTPREREVAALVAKGVSNKIIARELDISDSTVKTHLSVIFQKLKVNDRLQLAIIANKH